MASIWRLCFVMLCACGALGATVLRLEPAASAELRGVSALPGGGSLLRGDRSLIVLSAEGKVVAARKTGLQLWFAAATPSGEIYAGTTTYNIDTYETAVLVTKLDANLKQVWVRSYPLPDRAMPDGAAVGTQDGGLIYAGNAGRYGFIIRLRSDGSIRWARQLEETTGLTPHSVLETRAGNVLVGGTYRSAPSLMQLSADGQVHWSRRYGRNDGVFHALTESATGNILLAGCLNQTLLIGKTDARGEVTWMRTATVPRTAEGRAITLRSNGHMVVANVSSDAVGLIVVDGTGTLVSSRRLSAGFHDETMFPLGLSSRGNTVFLTPPARNPSREAADLFVLDGSSDGWLSESTIRLVEVQIGLEDMKPEVKAVELAGQPQEVKFTELVITSNPTDWLSDRGRTEIGKVKPSEFRGRVEEAEMAARFKALLVKREFQKLDEIAATLRTKQSYSDPMRWHIGYFYDGVTSKDLNKDELNALLQLWHQERPASITASIAMAVALRDAADDYAHNSDENLDLKRQARVILDGLGDEAKADSRYWALIVRLTAELGDGDVREVARRAAGYSHDPNIFHTASFFLHERWGGSPQEYMEFADQIARLTSSTHGEAQYTWLAYQGRYSSLSQNFDQEFKVDWNRMKKGFHDTIRLAPDWVPTYHRLAMTAEKYGDRATARELFKRPELAWYDGAENMWRSRAAYERVQKWAERTTEPFVELPLDRWPKIVADDDSRSVRVETDAGVIAIGNGVEEPIAHVRKLKVSTHALKIGPDGYSPDSGTRLFVVACAEERVPCQQVVLTARPVFGLSRIGLEQEYSGGFAIMGAVVLNEEGHVVGVVNQSAPPPSFPPGFKRTLGVMDVREWLKTRRSPHS